MNSSWGDKSAEGESGMELKKTVNRLVGKFAIAEAVTMLFGCVVVIMWVLCIPGQPGDSEFRNDGLINMVLNFLSLQAFLLFISRLLTRKMPTTELPKQKLGFGTFICLIFINEGLSLIGGLLGYVPDTLFTSLFHSANSSILDASIPIWGDILFVCILVPIFEEMVFRKILIDRLAKHGELVCILASGILFGLFHGNFLQLFGTMLGGFLWAFVYLRTGKMVYPILLHILLNTFATISVYFGTVGYWLYIAFGFVGILVLIIWLCKKKFRLHVEEGQKSLGVQAKMLFTSRAMGAVLLIGLVRFGLYYAPAPKPDIVLSGTDALGDSFEAVAADGGKTFHVVQCKEFQVEETGEYIFSLNISVHDDPGYYSGIVLTDSNDKCINGLVGLYTDSMKMYSETLKKDTTYKVYVVQMTDEHQYRDCMRYFCQKGDDSSPNYNFEIENTSVNYFYRVVRK